MDFSSPAFWVAVLQIVAIDVLLSGDNAVVIALACRRLPPEKRRIGVIYGAAGAIGLRIALTFFAVGLLTLPYLRLVGALLLLWIGIKLILPEQEEGEHHIDASDNLMGAVKTIIVADFVMSLDNVVGVAAAAKGSMVLLVFGLLVSIPLIVWSSKIVLKLIDRFPVVVTLGGALLGYVGGEMLVSDVAVKDWVDSNAHWLHRAAPIGCAVLVVGMGKWIAARARGKKELVDLGEGG
ncbi:MAG: TerC family protein [Pseudomonadota bacterium]